jgi:hypothetical protein
MSDSICHCGSQAGYPHHPDCPRPLFNTPNKGEELRWRIAFARKRVPSVTTALMRAASRLLVAQDSETMAARVAFREEVEELVLVCDCRRQLIRECLAFCQAASSIKETQGIADAIPGIKLEGLEV